jgi:hypothetical protein
VGGYLIVHHNLSAKPPAAAHTTRHNADLGRGKYVHQRYYTVQPNDSLTVIAKRTGIGVNTLESLNPSLNPNALLPGQQIRLHR